MLFILVKIIVMSYFISDFIHLSLLSYLLFVSLAKDLLILFFQMTNSVLLIFSIAFLVSNSLIELTKKFPLVFK